jgi:hypothetical protein
MASNKKGHDMNITMNKYYSQLIGATIVGFKWYEDENILEPMPVFILSLGGQKVELSLSMDEEGNGGGFGFIEVAT